MIATEIVCNDCGCVGMRTAGPARMKPIDMRRMLYDAGWVQIGGKDYCSKCFDKFNAPRSWARNKPR
jgi:hypothetical protein